MKKIVMFLFVVCATVAANAQVYAGGSLGFGRNSDVNVNLITIAPEVGYNLNDNWAIGAELEYKHYKKEDLKINTYGINPYVRYSYFNKGIVSLFVDGGFGINASKIKDADDEIGFNIGFVPGIAIKLTDKFSLVSKLGFLGYKDDLIPDDNGVAWPVKTKEFGFNLSNNITFGFFVNF